MSVYVGIDVHRKRSQVASRELYSRGWKLAGSPSRIAA